MHWDPYRPNPTEQIRRKIAELSRTAEIALRERDEALQIGSAAVRERETARRERDAALRERDAALRAREEALREREEALRAKEEAPRVREEAPRAESPKRAEESDSRLLELAADLANVRRNRDEAVARARSEERAAAVRALASVGDDLERSLAANSDRSSPWYQGHAAILSRLQQTIRSLGAKPIGAVGDRFDPHVHEAVGTGEGEPGCVVSVEQVGFTLEDGTLARPAVVKIAS